MSSSTVQPRTRMPRVARVAVERARLTVVPRRRTRAARMPFVVLVSLVLLGGVVGLLLFNTSMQQASFAATSLEQQAGALTARQQTLEMELDDLRNPQRIAEQAQAMGMAVPPAPLFLDLGTDRVMGDPAAATASAADRLRLLPQPPAKPRVLDPAPLVVQSSTTARDSGGDTAAGGREAGGASGTDGNTRATARDQR